MREDPVDSDSSESLTVEERFFLHIARKNNLISVHQAQEAVLLCRQRDLSLEEALRAHQLLDEAQIRRVREAMAASQVVRLDAVYADVAYARGLVSRPALDECFAEQRRQRYRVRIGNLLVERGHLKPDLHRTIISEVIRRLKHQGPTAYGPNVEKRGDAAAESALLGRPLPPTARDVPLDGSDAAMVRPRPPASDLAMSGNVPDPSASAGVAVGWKVGSSPTSSGRSPLAGEDSLAALLTSLPVTRGDRKTPQSTARPPAPPPTRIPFDASGEAEEDPLVASAIRSGLSSAEHKIPLHTSDERASQRDLLAASGDLPPPSAEPEGSGVGSSAGSSADDGAAPRKRPRIVPLVLLLVLASLAVAGVGAVVVVLVSKRAALGRARTILARAEAEAEPAARLALFQEAGAAIDGAEGVGADADEVGEARGRARWGALEAEVRVALAGGQEEEGRALLEAHAREMADAYAAPLEALRREASRSAALRAGRDAEARGDLAAAVAAYRDARDAGDPGGAAKTRLTALRQDLQRRLDAAWKTARESLSEADEASFASAAKLVTELFNEDPGITERLEELRFRRALKKGLAGLDAMAKATGPDGPTAADLDAAQQQLEAARRLRPTDAEVARALERLAARRSLGEEVRRGREAEAQKRFEEAAEFYRHASQLAEGAERERLAQDARRCEEQGGSAREREKRRQRGLEAVARLKESKVAEARAILEELVQGGSGDTARRLLELARKVDGMVFVPAGPFTMGSGPGPKVKAPEQPAHVVELPGYFIDRTEVTNAAWAKYLAGAGVEPPQHFQTVLRDGSGRKTHDPQVADHPVIYVSWLQARAFAEWRGARLPTEAEWEKAARGKDERTYPWGEGTSVRAHIAVPPDRLRAHPTAPVGAYPGDVSPYGALDLGGNVNEWTADLFGPYPGAPAGVTAPTPPRRTIRGGAYRWTFDDARCTARDSGEEGYVSPTVGLRCVVDVPPELAAVLR